MFPDSQVRPIIFHFYLPLIGAKSLINSYSLINPITVEREANEALAATSSQGTRRNENVILRQGFRISPVLFNVQ